MKKFLLATILMLTTAMSFAQDIFVIRMTDGSTSRIKISNIESLTFANSADLSVVVNSTTYPTTTSFKIDFESTMPATKAGVRYGLQDVNANSVTATAADADGTKWTATIANGINFNTTYTVQAYAWIDGAEYTTDVFTVTTLSKFPVAEAVDLALPSGVKWSSFNMGASSQNALGLYLPWGDVTGNAYSYSTYPNVNITVNNISGTAFDIATYQWGGDWRMPTIDELKELWDNTTHEYLSNFIGEKHAVKLTGSNGNSIIIPLAGEMENGSPVSSHRNYAYLWASTRNPNYNDIPECFIIVSASASGYNVSASNAYQGFSVRPVSGKNKNAEIGQEREYVNLGISTLWAKTNYGAQTATDKGAYLAWGELEEKSDYSLDNYSHYDGKYLEGKLDSNNDVVKKNWGGKWHMPSYAEMNELLTMCTWTWTTMNGVQGYEVRGTGDYKNNSIFLPVSGGKTGTSTYWPNEGNYWCGESYRGTPYWAYYLTFDKDNKAIGGGNKEFGFLIRPCRDF